MSLVYIPGVWDLLHVGHINILEKARALGDKLVVGVASDAVVMADKHSFPTIPLAERLVMLGALKCVDEAAGYYNLTFLPHLTEYRPAVLVVGEHWGTALRHKEAEKWASSNDCEVIKISYYKHQSTTRIKNKVIDGSI